MGKERLRLFSQILLRMETGCDMIAISELIPEDRQLQENHDRSFSNNLRVAAPGIVREFNADEQTVTVQVAIREKRLKADGTEVWADIPQLVDVPIVFPRAGGYAVTFPINEGDECLVVFGDMCIDAWWQSGGVQNQIDCRRHDLSDAFAIFAPWSQPRVLPNYSTSSVQMRNDAGSAYVEISGNTINIVGGTVNINGGTVNINA